MLDFGCCFQHLQCLVLKVSADSSAVFSGIFCMGSVTLEIQSQNMGRKGKFLLFCLTLLKMHAKDVSKPKCCWTFPSYTLCGSVWDCFSFLERMGIYLASVKCTFQCSIWSCCYYIVRAAADRIPGLSKLCLYY